MDFTPYKRIVIKIGSTLVADKDGRVQSAWLETVAQDIRKLRDDGVEVILVCSGAVALGRHLLKKKKKSRLKLSDKQAAAALGQPLLMETFMRHFSTHDLLPAQILITLEDSEDRRRYINARSTIRTLLKRNAIPVINENDSIATSEIRFGDNDRLAARVAQMMDADLLILLSDIDGLYTKNPNEHADAEHLPEVKAITPEIMAMGGNSSSDYGSGGMITKIVAADIAAHFGCHTIITLGKEKHPIKRLIEGAKHTRFLSEETPRSAKKHWIADTLVSAGEIIVDAGAVKALQRGKSLLPAGVVSVNGTFGRGDPLTILDESNNIIGKGLSAFKADDARKIAGRHSDEIEPLLGYQGRTTMIHRDNMVVFES
jgi:glutamate 5-kinase